MLTGQIKNLLLVIMGGFIIIALQEFSKDFNNIWIEPLHYPVPLKQTNEPLYNIKQKMAEPLDNIKIQNILQFRYPKLVEKSLTNSNSHIKHIYFVNNNPDTIGKRNLTIPRFGIPSKHPTNFQMEAIVRTYDLAYFMKSMYTVRPSS